MTFSIVIPTYNGEEFVEQAILSALNQTRKADEIIISDDNSLDQTITICRKYANQIKLYQNNKGPSGFVNGWNHAISKATCDFITILHQDDLLAPTFIEQAEKALTDNPPIKHLFAPCNYIDSQNRIIQNPDYCNGETKIYTGQEYVTAYQTIGHPHIHRCPGVITHRDIFKICRYRKEAGHIADDDFFYRVGQYTNIIGILKPLASYRIHKGSETGHLENNSLIQRLANDYIFQAKEWQGNTFMTAQSYEYFSYWAKYYAFNELFMGIKHRDKLLLKKGKKDIKRLQQLKLSLPFKMKLFTIFMNIIGENNAHKIICLLK